MAGEALIDGRTVLVREGETILEAARGMGIHIPTLCYSQGLAPEGGCRLCLVEVNGGGKPSAACHTLLAPGMRVRTETPRLAALRRDVLSLILSAHGAGTFTAQADGDELSALMARLDLAASAFGHHGQPVALDDSHPYLRFDASLCVTCRRCLHACEEVQGQFVYGFEGRGHRTRLIFGPSERFVDSDCTACGACVDHCPTGALSDRDRRAAPLASSITDSVCGYCGVGCRIRIEARENRVLRIQGVSEAEVNRGHLCAKGRYAHAYHHHAERLTRPLRRDGESWKEIGWEEALDLLVRRLTQIRDHSGPDALGVITSSRSTNEAGYLLQKLFRTAIGTNNVDCCARVCHSSTALALAVTTGTGAASASYADIERARCIVLAGANPTEAHPVVGARLKQAVLGGAALVVIDPRRIELAEYADLHLPVRAGTNVALFNALARVLIEEGLYDADYVGERLEGFAEFKEFLQTCSLAETAGVTGIEAAVIREAARLLGRHGPTLFVHGLGLSELTQGTASVMTFCNLGMLTGSIGRPGAGMLPLRGQNNVQGNADMGGMPDRVTGYQPVSDSQVRARLAEVWGKAPPARPGKTVPEMIAAAVRGELRALWVQGEDIAQSECNQSEVIEALQKLDFLVVQDLFLCETARYAHLVLPSASALEQEGTFTNGERRIQRVRPGVEPPGQARPDWQVVMEVAQALGERWSYAGPGDVMEEIARVAPRLFGGVRYDRLLGDGLQWPCPSLNHPGTATVHAQGFIRGKGLLVSISHEPGPEQVGDAYPYVLITGRILQHYNVGTMTLRTPHRELVATDVLEIHPEDARREGVAEGDLIHLASRWGETQAPVHLSHRVAPGTLFLSFHHPQTHTNRLVGPHVDPQSKCPAYKVTAVRLQAAQ